MKAKGLIALMPLDPFVEKRRMYPLNTAKGRLRKGQRKVLGPTRGRLRKGQRKVLDPARGRLRKGQRKVLSPARGRLRKGQRKVLSPARGRLRKIDPRAEKSQKLRERILNHLLDTIPLKEL